MTSNAMIPSQMSWAARQMSAHVMEDVESNLGLSPPKASCGFSVWLEGATISQVCSMQYSTGAKESQDGFNMDPASLL